MDLRAVDIIYLHGPHRPERKIHIEKMLESKNLNGTCVEGICDQGSRSGVVSMIRLLESRLEDFRPFVCLEDDCSATGWTVPTFSVPEDADAVYLGISAYGLHPDVDQAILRIEGAIVPTDPTIVRIYSMLSTHAIFYNTRRWVENCIECYKNALASSRPESWDIPLARSQKRFNVYALRTPMFYQDSVVGGQQEPTLINLQ